MVPTFFIFGLPVLLSPRDISYLTMMVIFNVNSLITILEIAGTSVIWRPTILHDTSGKKPITKLSFFFKVEVVFGFVNSFK